MQRSQSKIKNTTRSHFERFLNYLAERQYTPEGYSVWTDNRQQKPTVKPPEGPLESVLLYTKVQDVFGLEPT